MRVTPEDSCQRHDCKQDTKILYKLDLERVVALFSLSHLSDFMGRLWKIERGSDKVLSRARCDRDRPVGGNLRPQYENR